MRSVSPSVHTTRTSSFSISSNTRLGRTEVGWVRLLCFLAVLFAVIEVSSYNNVVAASYGLFILGAILLLVNIRWGFLYYLAVNLLSTDTTYTLQSFSSVHTTTVAGVTIMTLWTLLVFFASIAYILPATRFGHLQLQWQRFDKLMIVLGALFTFAAVVGLRNLDASNLRIFISDASYYVNAVAAYLAVRVISRDKKSLNQVIAVVIVCLVIRAVVGVAYFILGIGAIAGANVRAVTDSIRVLFPLLVLFGVAHHFYSYRSRFFVRFIVIVGAVTGMFNVVSYASRGNFILLAVGVVLLLVVAKTDALQHISISKFFTAILIVAIFLGVVVGFMQGTRPGSLDFIGWKLATLADIDYDRDLSSAAVRWLSFKNVVAHLSHNGTIIWGEGLGGWFTDRYFPFAAGLLGGSAFADEWILQGRLYKPHETVSFVLLKMGVGGILVYYGVMLLLFLNSIRLFQHLDNETRLVKFVALALVAFMPFLFYKNFISKIQVFMGVTFGVIASIESLYLLSRQQLKEITPSNENRLRGSGKL